MAKTVLQTIWGDDVEFPAQNDFKDRVLNHFKSRNLIADEAQILRVCHFLRQIQRNKSVILLGPTYSGKTTLIQVNVVDIIFLTKKIRSNLPSSFSGMFNPPIKTKLIAINLDMVPLKWLKNLDETLNSGISPYFAKLGYGTFSGIHHTGNLIMLLLLHYMGREATWPGFIFCCVILGLAKNVFWNHQRRKHIEFKKAANTHLHHKHDPGNSVHAGVDEASGFYLQDTKPTYDWLNNVIQSYWLNYQAYPRHLILSKFWPSLQDKNPALQGLNFQDFGIGDQAPRIDHLNVIDSGCDEIIVHLELTYEGNAHISLGFLLESLNISGSGKIEKITLNQLKLMVVLKNVTPVPPFFGGAQFFLLDFPHIFWQTGGLAKLADIKYFDELIHKRLTFQIKKLIYPRRVCIATSIPLPLREKIPSKLPVKEYTTMEIARPNPKATIKVTAFKAEELLPTDLRWHHCNWDNIKKMKFACSDFLPKLESGDPYVIIKYGQKKFRSHFVPQDLNPVWNFSCYFPVEYVEGTDITIELWDSDLLTSDDNLGKIVEKVSRIKSEGSIHAWYNCQGRQGRILVGFQWISLQTTKPTPAKKVFSISKETSNFKVDTNAAVLCLTLGKLTFKKSKGHAKVILRVDDGGDGEKAEERKAEGSINAETRTVDIDEGYIFRITSLEKMTVSLKVEFLQNDPASSKDRLMEYHRSLEAKMTTESPLDSGLEIYNHERTECCNVSLHSQILYEHPL